MKHSPSALKRARTRKRKIRKLALKILEHIVVTDPGQLEQKLSRVESIARGMTNVPDKTVTALLHYLSNRHIRRDQKQKFINAKKNADPSCDDD